MLVGRRTLMSRIFIFSATSILASCHCLLPEWLILHDHVPICSIVRTFNVRLHDLEFWEIVPSLGCSEGLKGILGPDLNCQEQLLISTGSPIISSVLLAFNLLEGNELDVFGRAPTISCD